MEQWIAQLPYSKKISGRFPVVFHDLFSIGFACPTYAFVWTFSGYSGDILPSKKHAGSG